MGFVFGQVIRHTGLFAVQVGTPQIFGSDHLAGGRFYQWWAGQEDGGLFFHHDHFVGHGGHISAAGGAGTEHDTDLRNATGGHVGHVEKDAPEVFAVREYLVLAGQVGTAGIYQVNTGQTVFRSNGLGAQVFFHGERVVAAAFYGGVVGDDHAFHTLHLGDTPDAAGGGHVFAVDAFGGQGGDFQKRGPRVEQQIDALAYRQLAALTKPLLGCFATAMGNVIELVLQLLTQLQVVFPVGLEVRAVGIDLAIDLGHRIPRLHAARLHGPRWWARAGVVRAAC